MWVFKDDDFNGAKTNEVKCYLDAQMVKFQVEIAFFLLKLISNDQDLTTWVILALIEGFVIWQVQWIYYQWL